ncbi:MAG: hypothetical protein JW850_20285 [Thermoflexales bacterium]|nr:hypothetical protein [Thermoflexales bacterium]
MTKQLDARLGRLEAAAAGDLDDDDGGPFVVGFFVARPGVEPPKGVLPIKRPIKDSKRRVLKSTGEGRILKVMEVF